jgi:hypothetical protein
MKTPLDMKFLVKTALAFVTLAALTACQTFNASAPATAHLPKRADRGLDYVADEHGDRIPDFSFAGYMGGGVRIPQAPVAAIVEPDKGDDGKRIQQAIDRVSRLPLDDNGFRGAVLLTRGKYQIEKTLSISASGVLLRGEGQGDHGTTLIATGRKQRTFIRIAGSGKPEELRGSRQKILDDYVPVGAFSFEVAEPRDFRVGDRVIVHRPSTAEWISTIGMDRLEPRSDGVPIRQWEPGKRDLFFDRIITAVNGRRITVDAPICNGLERRYGPSSVYRYEFDERISQVGIENLRAVSEYKDKTDEDHAWIMIEIDAAENGWVRDVTGEHFGRSLVTVGRHAKWITVEDCRSLDPVSQIAGQRRYSFAVMGQLTLVQRCYSKHGRHDFVFHGGEVTGPNVFLDCVAEEAHSYSGPHGWWCAGALFDNVRIRGDGLHLMNLKSEGSGHGWAGANMVLWNCTADQMTVENPPTAQNWAIGCKTQEKNGDGHWASFGRTAAPASLYLSQLEQRLGAQAVENIATRKPGKRR